MAYATRRPNEAWHYSDGSTKIVLTRGKVAWVDTADYALVKSYRWCAHYASKTWYASTNVPDTKSKSGWRCVKMHQMVFPIVAPAIVDHEDGDGLNNRRYNLRSATPVQNGFNRRKQIGTTSGHVGVHWCGRDKRWIAQIGYGMERIRIGAFKSEEDARKARAEAEKQYHPDFERKAV